MPISQKVRRSTHLHVVTPAMLQEGVDVLLFFDPEISDHKEYAEKIYRAMVEVSYTKS